MFWSSRKLSFQTNVFVCVCFVNVDTKPVCKLLFLLSLEKSHDGQAKVATFEMSAKDVNLLFFYSANCKLVISDTLYSKVI